MKASEAVDRMLKDLQSIAADCNKEGEYTAAQLTQNAILALDALKQSGYTNLEEVELPDPPTTGDAASKLKRTDVPHLRDAIRWLDDVPATNGNYQNAQAVREHLQKLIERVPK